MLKKLTSLLLILALGLSLWVMPVAAAETEDFTTYAAAVYDAFAASVYQPLADENAIDQLLEPAFYGNGSDMVFDEKDPVTAAIYESSLFREFFICTVSSTIAYMQEQHVTKLMGGGCPSWYDFRLGYTAYQYKDTSFEGYDDLNDPESRMACGNPNRSKTVILSGNGNRCDSAMILVAGGTSGMILVEQTAIDADTVTYKLSVRLKDCFDFSTSNKQYSEFEKKGYDTSLAKLLNIMGPLLRMKTFNWESRTEMSITVPNTCSHAGEGVYRWEKGETDLENVTGDGLTANPIERITFESVNTTTNVTTVKYYYRLDEPINLRHDDPWYVEYKMNAASTLYIGPGEYYSYALTPAFLKYKTRVNAIEAQRYRDISPKTGKKTVFTKRHDYGLDFVEAGTPKSGIHVYRIENRIAADGTNSLWLWVDGQELGQMKDYQIYMTYDSKDHPQGEDATWANGKDFIIRYIFNNSYYFTKTMNVSYVEISTGGDGRYVAGKVDATCTNGGGEGIRCELCGAITVENPGQPLPHTPKTVPGYAPSCTDEGLTEGSVCADCGLVLVAQEAIPMLEHTPVTVEAIAPSCKTEGLTEGKKCGDCGKVLEHQQTIPSTGHVFESMPSKPATCTEEGSSGGSWCPTCEKILMPSNVLPALGHNFKNGKCKNCGEPDPDVPVLMGDADGDGAVTYMDAMQALQMAVGLLDANLVCDMDADNLVTYLDAMQILRLAVGLA